MLLRVDHETILNYSEPVAESVVEVRMAPPSTADQTALGQRLRVTPSVPTTAYRDGFGNRAELFTVFAPHRRVVIQSACCVRLHRRAGAERLAGVRWDDRCAHDLEALEYLRPSP